MQGFPNGLRGLPRRPQQTGKRVRGVMATSPTRARLRRRPFQFRLRTLLDVVTIVALFAGAWRISAATKAPLLVEWALAAGFSVLWLVTRRIVPAPVKDEND
jgi:hypothetical protein